MSPMSKEEEGPAMESWNLGVDLQRERLTAGPNGNHILMDSPSPSELPPYSSVGHSPRSSREQPMGDGSTERIQKPRRKIGSYDLVSTLGSGSMGKVRLAVHEESKEKLAVKIVPRRVANKDRTKDENREIRTVREASMMLLLHHPYIASVKELVIMDPYYYLFMEYVNGGQLLDFIISHGKLKERQSRRFARQILSALDYCHRNSIVHRDLKIENILISHEGNVKIIDFGLSNLFSPRSSLSTFCGSLYFAAPELLNAKAYTGPEVDVWSFGVVLYVLVCGKVPFDDQSMPALHEKIKRGTIEYPSHLSTECKSVLSRMLVSNPTHRATLSELMIHPWMNRGYDGPIDNHVPDRLPLSLPVNMEVVRQMTGFEFGTEEEIKARLEGIIRSEEYQVGAQVLFERTVETQRNHRQNQRVSRFTPHTRSFVLPNEDPQSIPGAYHPLVSIYYLARERLERERAANEQEPPVPQIHPTELPVSDDELSMAQDNKRQSLLDIGLSRLFSKHSENEGPEPETLFRRFSALARTDTPDKAPDPTQSTPLQPPTEPKRVRTTSRRMTVGQSPLEGFSPPVLPKPPSPQGTADKDIRPVFLKGLFSVSTTSTKHPSAIRADLIRVLDRIHVRWSEGKGLFECLHMPSIDLRKVDPDAPDLVVRFEIYIVKVPWLLGMHGLQFRRLAGNPWQYKNMCSRILAELKL